MRNVNAPRHLNQEELQGLWHSSQQPPAANPTPPDPQRPSPGSEPKRPCSGLAEGFSSNQTTLTELKVHALSPARG